MSSLLNKLKPSSHKKEDDQGEGEEQKFTTQPHPAKTNDPRDLEPPQPGGGLNSNPEVQAFHTPGPYIPSEDVLKNVEQPKSREELKAQSAQLNAD